ncbi:uncharacterized protein Dwil_GK26832 [Drosophila willistoni]|uniref:Uncharacterized protein n=2 Tax=Drosophila willistoni TaxID=7260 RepID=A0A0Q9X0I1_DROWI|nr:uncharacterized protein Dwil_GK26832 [Drosophila willistoni]
MTPSNAYLSQAESVDAVTASAPPEAGAGVAVNSMRTMARTSNVWRSDSDKIETRAAPSNASYAPNMEEFPTIGGAKVKKHKVNDGSGYRNDPGASTSNAQSSNSPSMPGSSSRTRGGRGRHVSAPVLGNFLPSAIPPTSTAKHQEVGEWLKSVREMSHAKEQQKEAKKKQDQEEKTNEKARGDGNEPTTSHSTNSQVIPISLPTQNVAARPPVGNKQCGMTRTTRANFDQNKRRNRRSQRNWNNQTPVQSEPNGRAGRSSGLKSSRPGHGHSQYTNQRPARNATAPRAPRAPPITVDVSRSRLNSNAMEFRPTLGYREPDLLATVPPHVEAMMPQQPGPSDQMIRIGDRRSRQRFTRSLRPDTLFELVAPGLLPTPNDPFIEIPPSTSAQAEVGAFMPDQQVVPYQPPQPTQFVLPPGLLPTPNDPTMNYYMEPVVPVPLAVQGPYLPDQSSQDLINQQSLQSNNNNLVWNAPHLAIPMQQQNSNVAQSVFRLASLPSTGVGTVRPPEQSSIREVCTIPQTAQSSEAPDQWTNISPLPSSITCPSPSITNSLNISHHQWSAEEKQQQQEGEESIPTQHRDLQYTRPSSSITNSLNISRHQWWAEEKQQQQEGEESIPIQHRDLQYTRPSPSITNSLNISHHQWSAEENQQQEGEESIPTQHRDLQYTRQLLDMDRTMTLEGETATPEAQEAQDAPEAEEMEFMTNITTIDQGEIIIDVTNTQNAGTINRREGVGTTTSRAPQSHSPNSNHHRQTSHQLFGAKSTKSSSPDLRLMPESISKLYNLICSNNSDYAFVYALSAQLCQKIVPMDSFVYLKMALLASLASIDKDEMRQPIALCIISTDSSLANLLLTCVGQLAPRFIGPHSGGQQPSFNALPTRYNWITASPLLMAQRGVYYAGDWTCLSRDQSEELQKCIENGVVPVPQISGEQLLEAAVWTYWQPEHSANQTTTFANFCPIFGLPIYMGELSAEDITNFIIHQYSENEANESTQDALDVSDDDMRLLFLLLHERQVNFSDQAQYILKKYFIVSRKERPSVFTSKTYIVLKQFAESFAKLALRLDVLIQDIIVAIFHSEYFVQHICGVSSCPPPAVTNINGIQQVDAYMNDFGRWLFEYLDRYQDDELDTQQPPAKRHRASLDV